MKRIVCFLGALISLLTACTSTQKIPVITEAPVMSAYYSDWDRAVRADVDMQNMYANTPSKITKPIDMYMAMALALKYNYTRRLASYHENLIKSNITPSSLPMISEKLGYENKTNSLAIPADLKVSWNILDVSGLYYQNNLGSSEIVAEEQNRKVINNIMLEARSLYWKTLAAQRLIPVIDDMNEYLVRVVDEINAHIKNAEHFGESPSTDTLLKKRKYLENIKHLAELKRNFDTAQAEFSGFLGLHPSAEIKLAGSEYGNFAIPSLRAKMKQLEWLALTNRPELRVFDDSTLNEELELVVKDFGGVEKDDYCQNSGYYNTKWSKSSNDLSTNLFEDIRYQEKGTFNSLARQRLANIILSQVHLSWALYQSAVEDYYLNMSVASTSEDIAEDITLKEGTRETISHLESARAIIDETNAFLSYIDVQEAIGRLYASLGVDAVPPDMLNDDPSVIAVQIRKTLDKWRDGIFLHHS